MHCFFLLCTRMAFSRPCGKKKCWRETKPCPLFCTVYRKRYRWFWCFHCCHSQLVAAGDFVPPPPPSTGTISYSARAFRLLWTGVCGNGTDLLFCASLPIFVQLSNFWLLSDKKAFFFFWPFRASLLLVVAGLSSCFLYVSVSCACNLIKCMGKLGTCANQHELVSASSGQPLYRYVCAACGEVLNTIVSVYCYRCICCPGAVVMLPSV